MPWYIWIMIVWLAAFGILNGIYMIVKPEDEEDDRLEQGLNFFMRVGCILVLVVFYYSVEIEKIIATVIFLIVLSLFLTYIYINYFSRKSRSKTEDYQDMLGNNSFAGNNINVLSMFYIIPEISSVVLGSVNVIKLWI